MKNESKGWRGILLTAFLTVLAVFFLIPVFLVLMNSLKGQFYISDAPFALPNSETFVGLRNYWNGIEKVDFFSAFGYSAFITLFSVAAIVLFTAMTAWYLVRAGTRAANGLYYLFVFSMIVPFQMVMFTMSKMANLLRLDNPVGIILLYLGFGSGLSVFLYRRKLCNICRICLIIPSKQITLFSISNVIFMKNSMIFIMNIFMFKIKNKRKKKLFVF